MTKRNNKFWCRPFLLTLLILVGLPAHSYARDMSEYSRVKLQSLDKITAHTMTFEANVGSTLKFGSLYMKVQSCQKSSPIDEPESAAFIQIWEIDANEKSHWVFSGWMFASSPGLSPMDHAIYDVWVIDCLEDEETKEQIDQNESDDETSSDTSENKAQDQQEHQGDILE